MPSRVGVPSHWAGRPLRCTARIRRWDEVLAELGSRDRTQLTRYAIGAGLIEP